MTHVLIVEDDRITAQILDNLLTSRGFDVNHFEVAAPALQSLSEKSYDVALLDINLPDTNGISLIAQMRNEFKVNIPIIMLSALKQEAVIQEALGMGANDYLSKPFKPQKLLQTIRKHTKG